MQTWSLAALPQPNDLSRSPAALDQDSTLIAVIEMSQSGSADRRHRSGDERAWGIGRAAVRKLISNAIGREIFPTPWAIFIYS